MTACSLTPHNPWGPLTQGREIIGLYTNHVLTASLLLCTFLPSPTTDLPISTTTWNPTVDLKRLQIQPGLTVCLFPFLKLRNIHGTIALIMSRRPESRSTHGVLFYTSKTSWAVQLWIKIQLNCKFFHLTSDMYSIKVLLTGKRI
jgi:hypothetical protein